MQVSDFLDAVITGPLTVEKVSDGKGSYTIVSTAETVVGFFCIAFAQANGAGFIETWYRWPNDRDEIQTIVQDNQDYNIYFSPYLFSAQSRARENVLRSRTIIIDLDEAAIDQLPIPPAALVRTSEGRHQGYWIVDEACEPSVHESLSRRLTYAIDKADRASWPIGHTARMPFTTNYKYGLQPHIEIVKLDRLVICDRDTIELLPDDKLPGTDDDIEWVSGGMVEPSLGPQIMMHQLKLDKRLPADVVVNYNITQSDRSTTLWRLMLSCFRAGLTRDEVFHLAWHSRNNKWLDVRYNGQRELAKDVLRAERVARGQMPDSRAEIVQLRTGQGVSFEKHAQIARIVYDRLMSEGDLVHTNDNMTYYVKRDIGRPITIARASEHMASLLDIQFGLNASEEVTRYTLSHILSKAISLPDTTEVSMLSAYDRKLDAILLHTGRRDVLRITANNIDRFTNGSHGVLFPWNVGTEPFQPDFTPLPNGEKWWEMLFEDSFLYVQDMEPHVALALMRVYTLFIIMRKMVETRPILAFFGPPGSGKTTIMKRLYRLFYGRNTELLQLTTPEKFDLSTVKNPFVCIDNADNYVAWLPDRMATAISDVQSEQRKLWTDGDVFLQKRQAVLAVTAHNPKFGREDISSRLLLLTFNIIPDAIKRNEAEMYARVTDHRNQIWGGVIKDIQATMRTPPVQGNAPAFRIADFAILGARIARAIGVEAEFANAIQSVRTEQKLFTLEEENSIVTALLTLTKQEQKANLVEWRTSGKLWSTLALYSGNAQNWERTYRDSRSFSKKLQAMSDALSRMFVIETHTDTDSSVRMWRVTLNESMVASAVTQEQLKGHVNGTV